MSVPTNTIVHLEMRERSSFRPSELVAGFNVVEIDSPEPGQNRELYIAVGGPWQWTDRLSWSDEDWRRVVCRDVYRTYLAQLNGEEVGYFELEAQEGGDVEIVYFGLLPEWIGMGLGGALLTAAVERAWGFPETRRVWVHTCTNDHEHALENYKKRGFEVFKTERGDEAALK